MKDATQLQLYVMQGLEYRLGPDFDLDTAPSAEWVDSVQMGHLHYRTSSSTESTSVSGGVGGRRGTGSEWDTSSQPDHTGADDADEVAIGGSSGTLHGTLDQQTAAEVDDQAAAVEVDHQAPVEVDHQAAGDVDHQAPVEVDQQAAVEVDQQTAAEVDDQPAAEVDDQPAVEVDHQPAIGVVVLVYREGELEGADGSDERNEVEVAASGSDMQGTVASDDNDIEADLGGGHESLEVFEEEAEVDMVGVGNEDYDHQQGEFDKVQDDSGSGLETHLHDDDDEEEGHNAPDDDIGEGSEMQGEQLEAEPDVEGEAELGDRGWGGGCW
eukprot:jgi/Chrzof1/13773/Cz08g11190.t1